MRDQPTWRQFAECRLADPHLFFGSDDETPAEKAGRERAAVIVCAGCPVRVPCAAFSIGNRIAAGVWGGLTESARQRVLSRVKPH